MEKKVKKSKNHIVIKDKKKFITSIVVLLGIIVLIVFVSFFNRKQEINDETDLSKLNSKKYSSELLVKYNQSKEKFLDEYDKIQSGVGMYIINNSTLDENSFEKVNKKIAYMFDSDDWSMINVDKNTFWNGKWSIDNSGTLKFKFAQKSIEPSWIGDEDIKNKIVLN